MNPTPYDIWIRSLPCVVAVAIGSRRDCVGDVQSCHADHSGMGGAKVPLVGNRWPGCLGHHGLQHSIWFSAFNKQFSIDVKEIATQLGERWERGDILDDVYA